MILLSSTVQEWSRSRIHERAIKLSILGMIWREFSSKAVEVSVNNNEENSLKNFRIASKNSASGEGSSM
jgi:hypothetical protein